MPERIRSTPQTQEDLQETETTRLAEQKKQYDTLRDMLINGDDPTLINELLATDGLDKEPINVRQPSGAVDHDWNARELFLKKDQETGNSDPYVRIYKQQPPEDESRQRIQYSMDVPYDTFIRWQEESIAQPELAVQTNEQQTDEQQTDVEQPPVTPEEIKDTEIRYTDAEILGKRYPVRRMVNEIGNQRMRMIESVQAHWQNTLDTPAKFRKGMGSMLATGLHNRQVSKYNNLMQKYGFTDEQGNNINLQSYKPTTFLEKHRHKKALRRYDKMQTAERRKTAAVNAYQSHKDVMTGRREAVGKNAEKRRQEYTKELRERREKALARKAMRHELKRQGANQREVRAILKDIPTERLNQVAHAAIAQEMAKRQLKIAEKTEHVDQAKADLFDSDLIRNAQQAQKSAEEAKLADRNADQIRDETLPQAESHLVSLKSRLDELADDDPARDDLKARIENAQDTVDYYIKNAERFQAAAERSRARVVALNEERYNLKVRRAEHQTTQVDSFLSADAARAEHQKRKNATLSAAADASKID